MIWEFELDVRIDGIHAPSVARMAVPISMSTSLPIYPNARRVAKPDQTQERNKIVTIQAHKKASLTHPHSVHMPQHKHQHRLNPYSVGALLNPLQYLTCNSSIK